MILIWDWDGLGWDGMSRHGGSRENTDTALGHGKEYFDATSSWCYTVFDARLETGSCIGLGSDESTPRRRGYVHIQTSSRRSRAP